MLNALKSVYIVLISFTMLCLGHGLLNSLVSIRASIEDFSNISIGIMGGAYFGGFIAGIYLCAELLKRVGHIRTFAGIASVTSALAIFFLITVHPLSWILIRFLYGICIACLYMSIESWLNTASNNGNRASVLSVYMILIYASFALGQSFLNVSGLDSYFQFLVVSILISLSVVPLCLSPKAQPIELSVETYSFKKLINLSPFGSLSCLLGGMLVGAIWSLLGAFLLQSGIESVFITLYISCVFLGALIFQLPLGRIIEKSTDKGLVIKWLCLIGAISNSLLFITYLLTQHPAILSLFFLVMGGTSFPIYSLSMAIILDFVESKHMTKASGSILMINAIGSMIGAVICAILMSIFGAGAFIIFCILCLGVNASGIYWIKRSEPQHREDIGFVPLPRSTIALQEFDPRVPSQTEKSNHAE